jgi:hypothetical protein
MPTEETLGKLKYVIEADSSGVKKAVSESSGEFEKLADTSEKSGERVGGALESVGQKMEDSTAGLRKLSGAVSSSVGIFTALTGAVTGLAGVLLLLKNRQDAARESARQQTKAYGDLFRAVQEFESTTFETAKAAEDAYQGILESIDAQNKVVEQSRLNALAATAKQIESEKILEGRFRETTAAMTDRNTVLDAQRDIYEKIANDVEKLIQDQNISLLPDDEQLKAQAERQKRILIETFGGVGLPDGLLDEALQNIDRIAERQRAQEQERQRIADEAQARREDEADRRSADRIQRETEAITSALNSITSSDFVTRLDSIAQAIKDGNRNIQRLK